MNETHTILTVLFADIVDSTRFFRDYGPVKGRRVVLGCLDRIAGAIEAEGGTVMDRIGDELMCTLPDPSRAVRAVFRMQDAVIADPALGESAEHIRLRIGFEHGAVVISQAAVFGDAVHTAKRMADLAKADQALTTSDTLAVCREVTGLSARFVERTRLKGHTRALEIYELVRDRPEVTRMSRGLDPQAHLYLACRIRYGDLELIVDERHPRLTIGRAGDCDLVLEADCVSRQHARIELQKGRIVCIDLSTNGTYVYEGPSRQGILLHREERWLHDRGELCLGKPADASGDRILHYTCE
jgi:class 3 adenylate cyclase